jgi:hypothetical protein
MNRTEPAATRSYAVHHALRELEWQSRFALSVADDLADALATGEHARATAAARALLVRVQKISELLWPGTARLADRLLPDRAASVRALLHVDAATPLTTERVSALYAMFDHPLDATQPGAARFLRRPVLLAGGRVFDFGAILAEVRRLWDRSSVLVVGE